MGFDEIQHRSINLRPLRLHKIERNAGAPRANA
jgi:hypothetical protein